jgi:GNAT superfamily N-acetyltransferase
MPSVALEIHPLSPAREADFMAFFDGEAFSDNPKWSSCYCQCFYEDHSKLHWPGRSTADNRACAGQRIARGQMQGLLAYSEGKVVGWCNAAPRPLLHALDAEPIANPEQVGTILCFLVAPNARGRGVATALLDAACEQLRAEGLLSVEANPRPAATSTAENHFGPLAMYLAAGFKIRRRDESDGSVWVGKELQKAHEAPVCPAAQPHALSVDQPTKE